MNDHDDMTNSTSSIAQLERRVRDAFRRLTKPSTLRLELSAANSTEGVSSALNLEISGSGSQRQASIQTSDNGFKLDGRDIAPQTQHVIDDWPLVLSHGEMTFSMERPGLLFKSNAKVKSRRSSPVLRASAILLFGLVLAGIPRDIIAPSAHEYFVLSLNPVEKQTEADAFQDELFNQFEQRLKEANLASSVSINSNTKDRTLVAAGTIPQAKASEWEDLLFWYDKQSNAGTLVTQVAFEAANTQIPPIAMVTLKEPREVLLANGQRLKTGDNFGGLKLMSIEPDKLQLRRGQDIIEVTLKEDLNGPN